MKFNIDYFIQYSSYTSGSKITVQVRITANHKGYFYFQLCNLDKYGGRESDQCYNELRLKTASGEDTHTISLELGNHDVDLQLPSGVTCKHCVLQWTYVAGIKSYFQLF